MSQAFKLFKSEDWLIHTTPGMRRLSGDINLWRKVVQITEANRT